MDHPEQSQLFEAAGPGTPAPAVSVHLAGGCQACAKRLATYRRIRSALEKGPLCSVPGRLLERTRASAASHPQSLIGARQELAGEWAVSLRGRRLSQARRVYRAGAFEVDLARLDNGSLLGQLLPLDEETPVPSSGTAILFPDGMPIAVPLESNGDFRIASPPPGPYSLCIEADGLRIIIEQIDYAEGPSSDGSGIPEAKT